MEGLTAGRDMNKWGRESNSSGGNRMRTLSSIYYSSSSTLVKKAVVISWSKIRNERVRNTVVVLESGEVN